VWRECVEDVRRYQRRSPLQAEVIYHEDCLVNLTDLTVIYLKEDDFWYSKLIRVCGFDRMIDKVAPKGRLPRVCGRDPHIEACFLGMKPFQGKRSSLTDGMGQDEVGTM